MFEAGFLGGIFNWVTDPVGSSALVMVGLFITWATKQWLVPLLNTTLRRQIAKHVLLIADEVTDQLVARYPNNQFVDIVDQSVDTIMKVCKVSKNVATRSAEAALGRKGIKNIK